MRGWDEYSHNDVISFTGYVTEVQDKKATRHAYTIEIATPDNDPITAEIWSKSPASGISWQEDRWYEFSNILFKRWENSLRLSATPQTTVEKTTSDKTIQIKTPSDGETSGAEVVPNPLSELYEAFRSIRSVIGPVLEDENTPVSATDESEAIVQYHAVIEALVGGSDHLPADMSGYGSQQASRTEFSMTQYREKFGNGDWITEFQCIEVESLRDETQRDLQQQNFVENPSLRVRPVAPGSREPLPEAVSGFEDLQKALELLGEFPIAPAGPKDDVESSEGFPIGEIYASLSDGFDKDTPCVDPAKLPSQRDRANHSRAGTDEETVTEPKTGLEDSSSEYCSFTWVPDEQSNPESRAYCCYRDTWREFDRCVWHAETDEPKPAEALKKAREDPENRKLNRSPRELLSGARLADTDLTGLVLTAVDLSGADLRKASLRDVYLGYSNLSQADLREADLTKCKLSKASLRCADLANASLTNLSIFRADFTEAELFSAEFSEVNTGEADFTGANPEAAKGLDADDFDAQDDTENSGSEMPQENIRISSGVPDPKRRMSIIHTTNTYLDRRNMGRAKRQEDFVSAFEEIVDYACKNNVDALVHAGNVFWSQQPDDWVVDACKRLLRDLKQNQVECILVRGERDVSRTPEIIQELDSDGLLSGSHTGWHQLGDIGIFVYSASSPPVAEINHTPPADVESHIAVLFDTIPAATDYESVSELEEALATSLAAVLIGDRIEPSRMSDSGTPILSPGMPERIVSKRSIESQLRTPVFFEYDIDAGSVDVTPHEINARPVSGFQIDMTPETTVGDIESVIDTQDLRGNAAVVALVGTRDENSITKDRVQELVSNQAAIARAYDERTDITDEDKSASRQTSSSDNWDVESLAAATTLDVEDIENSISKLMDVGCSREKALKYVRRYLTEMLQGDGLFAVRGIGPVTGRALVEAGITTVADLQGVTADDLTDRTDMTPEQIQRFQRSVKKQTFSSLDPGDEQVAKRLLDTSDEVTEIETSADTLEQVETESTDADRSGTESQGESRETPSTVSTNSGTVLSPDQLTVPDLNEHAVPGGGTVFPNHLTEYYEAFYNAKTVLKHVFGIPETDIDPDDRQDPRVQYYILLNTCIGFGDVSTRFTGYGPQHQNRLAFSVSDYRKVFGRNEMLTEYQVITVKPFKDETHELLREKANVESSKEFVRPCVPGTNAPIPELPGSLEGLQTALQQLATFPAYPPLPTENGHDSRTIPVAEIYETCFGDLEPQYQADLTQLTTTGDSRPTGPVPTATPTSETEAASTLLDYGRLSHLFRRITPPAASPAERAVNVFSLDWYRLRSQSFEALERLAKHGGDGPVEVFRPRLRDLIHRRFLLDRWDYDYITVFPGHEKGSLNPQLVELARDAVLETEIIYAPLLERTETVERQRTKSKEERQRVAINPTTSLRSRAKLEDATIILFDDICTTGSSLIAGAHLLRQAGAKRVVCVTLGLTPGGSRTDRKEITDPEAPASTIIAGVGR